MSLNVVGAIVFADLVCRICLLDVKIKDKFLRFISVYASNDHEKMPDLFRPIDPLLTTSRRVVLAGQCNAVFDPYIDRFDERSGTNYSYVKPF